MALKAAAALGRRPVGQAAERPGSGMAQMDSTAIHMDTTYRVEHFSFLLNDLRMERVILLSWATG